MTHFSDILAVIQDKAEAAGVIAHAQRLAQNSASAAHIHVVRVIYESIADISTRQIERSHELKQAILKAEESYLEDIIETSALGSVNVSSVTVWNKRTWEGVLDTATAVDADLIVKACADGGKGALIRTPDDWNLLRHSKIPVLLTGSESLPPLQPVLAAVDVLDTAHRDLNQAILKHSAALASICQSSLHIVSAYPRLDLWLGRVSSGIDAERIQMELEQEIQAGIAQLTDRTEITDYVCHIDAGPSSSVIEQVSNQIGGGLLVIGTKARAGVEAAMLGNTAESVLQDLNNDVVVVPLQD